MSDAEARFEAFVAEVADPVRRYLSRRTTASTAEDVLSETLLVCWRRAEAIPDDASVPWAIGVARLCLANVERSSRRRQRLFERIRSVDPPVPVLEESSPGAEVVTAALASLPARDAELLRLWAWEELSAPEIAAVLDVSVNAATVRLHRAKRKLRTSVESVRRAHGVRPDEVPDMEPVKGGDQT